MFELCEVTLPPCGSSSVNLKKAVATKAITSTLGDLGQGQKRCLDWSGKVEVTVIKKINHILVLNLEPNRHYLKLNK